MVFGIKTNLLSHKFNISKEVRELIDVGKVDNSFLSRSNNFSDFISVICFDNVVNKFQLKFRFIKDFKEEKDIGRLVNLLS